MSTDRTRVLSALADPTRRQAFELLRDGPLAVGELAARLPVSRPAVSQHLKVLGDAGLVTSTAAGTRRLYRVDPAGLAVLREWLDLMWPGALAAFAAAADRDEDQDSDDDQGERP